MLAMIESAVRPVFCKDAETIREVAHSFELIVFSIVTLPHQNRWKTITISKSLKSERSRIKVQEIKETFNSVNTSNVPIQKIMS